MDGQRSSYRISTWKWPRQKHPPKGDWNLWRIAIHKVWAKYETRRLSKKLGHWIRNSYQSHLFLFDNAWQATIEITPQGSYRSYQHMSSRSRHYTFTNTISAIPNHCDPVQVHTSLLHQHPNLCNDRTKQYRAIHLNKFQLRSRIQDSFIENIVSKMI